MSDDLSGDMLAPSWPNLVLIGFESFKINAQTKSLLACKDVGHQTHHCKRVHSTIVCISLCMSCFPGVLESQSWQSHMAGFSHKWWIAKVTQSVCIGDQWNEESPATLYTKADEKIKCGSK